MQYASDLIRAEGRAEGRAKGMAEGRAKGMAHALMLMLESRFGVLPEEVRQRIQTASASRVDRWIVKLPSAPTLDRAINGYDDE